MTGDQVRSTLIEILEHPDFELVEAGFGVLFFGYWICALDTEGFEHMFTSADQWHAVAGREVVPA